MRNPPAFSRHPPTPSPLAGEGWGEGESPERKVCRKSWAFPFIGKVNPVDPMAERSGFQLSLETSGFIRWGIYRIAIPFRR